MDPQRDPGLVRISRFLSYVLRHRPASVGLVLDEGGWVDVDRLIEAAQGAGVPLDRARLDEVVRRNDKRRFAVSPDGRRIRARQGHSVPVALGLAPQEPPPLLFHGTAARHLEGIRREGLRRGRRHHVHLSPDEDTARLVGARHGRPVALRVEALRMHRDGHAFFLTENGVWLTAHVPPGYIQFPEN